MPVALAGTPPPIQTMKDNHLSLRFGVLAGMILLAAASRVVPHPANFAPIGAMALFGGAYFRSRWAAYAVPLLALWLSDLYINNVMYAAYYDHFTWLYEGFHWIYAASLLTTWMGSMLLRHVSASRVALAAVLGSLLFFVVTNFGCWPGNPQYTQDAAGLVDCFAAGVPFFRGTVLGNLFYAALLFGGFELAQRRIPALRTAHAAA